MDLIKPYTDEIKEQHGTGESYILRTFEENVEDNEFVWHRDLKTRKVTPLVTHNWSLQFDDRPPFKLQTGVEVVILKETYHRLLKGDGKLVVRIKEI